MKKLLLFAIALTLFTRISAQSSNYLYGINDATNNGFCFSRIDLSAGTVTNLNLLSLNSFGNENSCTDDIHQIYYLSSQQSLMGFETDSGNIIFNEELPIPEGSTIICMAFNSCDTSIYGIVRGATYASFASYKPSTGQLHTISNLQPNFSYIMGGQCFIDHLNNLFVYQGTSVIGLDLTTGDTVYNSAIVNLPNEVFGHIALDWNTHLIYGTSANTGTMTKYLSTIDPSTGIVSHVSDVGWSSGIWKPGVGGDCINQFAGIYYYSASGYLINGVNITNGQLVSSQTVSSNGEFLLLKQFSLWGCNQSGILDTHSNNKVVISPNPFTTSTTIQINLSTPSQTFLQIFDMNGSEITTLLQNKTMSAGNHSINFNAKNNPAGIYYYVLRCNEKTEIGKMVLIR